MPGDNDLEETPRSRRRIAVPGVPMHVEKGTKQWEHETALVVWRTRVTDWMEDKDDQDERRFDTLVKLVDKQSETTLDKLLRADPKTLIILVVAGVAVVAIIWGASVGYGEWTVNAQPKGDGASMIEDTVGD